MFPSSPQSMMLAPGNDKEQEPFSESADAASAAAEAAACGSSPLSSTVSASAANVDDDKNKSLRLPTVRDPIRLLRCYLSQLAASNDPSRSTTDAVEGGNEVTQQGGTPCRRRRSPLSARQVDDLLRAADFLFGSNPSTGAAHTHAQHHPHHPLHHHHATGLLDGALALLDACGTGGEVAAAGAKDATAIRGQPSSSSSSSLITRAVARPSQRSIYLVQGGSTKSSSSNKRRRQNHNPYQDHHHHSSAADAESESGPHYLCFVPDEDRVDGNDGDSSGCCYYCSCRSFHDRSARQLAPVAPSSNTLSAAPPNVPAATAATTVLCKHLLALVLRPHLDVPIRVLEFGTDEEFGNYVLDRIGV
jgi:hypothetical protein